jgi:cytoskeletal protein RodZ
MHLVKHLKGAAPGLGSVLRLIPWLLLAVLMAVLLWHTQALATAGLFQSVLPTPTTSASPTSESATPGMPTPTAPSLTVTPTPTETSAVATSTPQATPSAMPTALPNASPLPTALATSAAASAGSQRYPESEADLRFSWRTLIDSLAVAFSYVWLACGIVVFVLFLCVLVLRWLRGRRSTRAQ